ncbi:MAG: Gfo/Idh/MocA family protein [Halobacteriales archaeon]
MPEDSFGIGFVSAGFITRESHAPSVEYLPGVEVAAILNPTEGKAADLAETCRAEGWGDPSVYGAGEVAAMAADPAVDGLWVTSPNHTRVDAIEAAVEAVADGASLAGIAMEKPVARDLAEADRIIEAIEGVGLPHAYLENWPHEPDIAKMRRLLWERGRDAGRPYIARSQAEHGGPHAAWFWDGTKQGGGALTDMLCHALAGNDFLLSDPETGGGETGGGETGGGGGIGGDAEIEPVAVSADAETLKWNRPAYADRLREDHGVDYEDSPADDYARATVRYTSSEGETLVSEATGSWCFVGPGVRRRIELLGPEYSGQVVADETASSVFFSDDAAEGEGWAEKQTATSGRMPVAAADVVTGGYVAENRDAVAAFRRGENGLFDLQDGRGVLELCMAAYLSAEEGREVDLREADLSGYTPPPARDGR